MLQAAPQHATIKQTNIQKSFYLQLRVLIANDHDHHEYINVLLDTYLKCAQSKQDLDHITPTLI